MNILNRFCNGCGYGEKLNIICASIANAICQDLSCDEIELISSMLQVIGESMSVIASSRQICGNCESPETQVN